MKILSDFDGVLTDQIEEAQRVRALFREELVNLTKAPQAIDQLLLALDQQIALHPSRHGWLSRGRITAFANEDLFIYGNGIAAELDRASVRHQGPAYELAMNLESQGHASFSALAQSCYQKMVSETLAGKIKPLDPHVKDLFANWRNAGHEVVIVSNSGTSRILDLLERSGIEAVSHESGQSSNVRVRGDAKKFELGETRTGFQVADYFIELDRPSYAKILKEENPDMVIGDVFSLDLALPYQLMRDGVLVLRERSYTPEWARQFCLQGQFGKPRLKLLKNLEELSQA